MNVTVEEIALHSDVRGSVFEPLTPGALKDQKNVHVVVTEPGGIRANHFHTRGTEVMTVLGPALVRYKTAEGTKDVNVPADVAYRFTFPPGVAHAVQNTGERANILVAFNTEEHDRQAPDVTAHKLIEAGAR